MNTHFDIWQLIGGLGLFLFAMAQLETALRSFAGRSLKQLLQRYTDRPIKSVLAGTLTTAILQSSSLVALMVLAFVGASIMSLQNALGVIFGANLGTTLTGWVVTTLGFKLDLGRMSLPLIGIGGLILVGTSGKLSQFGRIMTSIGFLLMGLEFMKDSVGSLGEAIDVARLADLAAWQYLLFGVVFAAIVQSSSATMMVTLAALHTGVIELPAAAAVAVGADLGTTSTVLIGAVQGAAVKKRVALAHFIFNLTTAVLAFAFRVPLLQLVAAFGIDDPLFSLVAFHSLFNLLGIVIFLPITRPFAAFLEKRFAGAIDHEAMFVSETTPTVANAALAAISRETAHIIGRVIRQNMQVFSPPLPTPPGELPVAEVAFPFDEQESFDKLYRQTKRLEGEILSFALQVQEQPLEAHESGRLNQLLSAVREAVHSAKSLRDIRHNLQDFADSPHAEVNAYLDHFRSVMTAFYGEIYRLPGGRESTPLFHDFADAVKRVNEWHDQLHREVYSDVTRQRLDESEISSLLNVNRELLNSNIALIMALKDFHLEERESGALSQLPEAG